MEENMTRLRCILIALLLVSVLPSSYAAPIQRTLGSAQTQGDQSLDKLADKPYRPRWAPIPIFFDKTSLAPVLNKALASKSPADRARSAFLLGQIRSKASAGLLAAHLHDADKNVRAQCGVALACMGDARGVSECAIALKSGPEWVRYYAAYGLWCANTPKARAILKRASAGGSDLVKSAIDGATHTPFTAFPKSAGNQSSQDVTPQKIWSIASDAFNRESDWWFHTGNYDQCIRCLEAAVLFDPHFVEGYSNIAYLQWSLGRDPQAVRTLHRCTAANPKDPNAYFELGEHLFITKHYAQAEPPLARSVKLGGDALARRTYAHCLEHLGKKEAALKQWEILVKTNPRDRAALVNMKRVKKELGR